MPEKDDYPRCQTCEHWHEPALNCRDGKTRALCEKSVGTGQEDYHTHPDFGCILNSELDDE